MVSTAPTMEDSNSEMYCLGLTVDMALDKVFVMGAKVQSGGMKRFLSSVRNFWRSACCLPDWYNRSKAVCCWGRGLRLDFLAGLGLLEEVALVVFLVAKSVSVVFLEGGDERATMIRFGWEAVVDTFSVFFSPNHDVGLPSGNRLDALPERFLVNGILVQFPSRNY